LRRARADRIPGLGYCRQGLVLDLDRFSGIARSGQRFSYDQRDWLTDVPHLAERKHRTGRVVPRRAVTILGSSLGMVSYACLHAIATRVRRSCDQRTDRSGENA
jgi:hypothetical protein